MHQTFELTYSKEFLILCDIFRMTTEEALQKFVDQVVFECESHPDTYPALSFLANAILEMG
jgi:hypothetical protein